MYELRLAISPLTKRVYAREMVGNKVQSRIDVTDDFRRMVVMGCSESVEFEVDGMKFKATCERID